MVDRGALRGGSVVFLVLVSAVVVFSVLCHVAPSIAFGVWVALALGLAWWFCVCLWALVR